MKRIISYGLSVCLATGFLYILSSCSDDNDGTIHVQCPPYSKGISAIEEDWTNPVPIDTSITVSITGDFVNGAVFEWQTRTSRPGSNYQTVFSETISKSPMETEPDSFALPLIEIDQSLLVRAIVTDCNGTQLFSNAVSITVDTTEITDIRDLQVYKVVTIGDQNWFAENLRYTGEFAPLVPDQDEWYDIALNDERRPAAAYYDNDAGVADTYGLLYNGFAVQTGNLCPDGWHIPSVEEWQELADTLGGAEVAGGELKAETEWREENVGATNATGFAALPGGYRTANGGFNWQGDQGLYWANDGLATMYYGDTELVIEEENILSTNGYSCRCIQD